MKNWAELFEVAGFDRQRAHRILGRLLDLTTDERPAILQEECAGDDALRAAVVRLLHAAEAPDSLLDPDSGWSDSLWAWLVDETGERSTRVAEGTIVGPYQILEEIGRGGMAIVYRAERIDG